MSGSICAIDINKGRLRILKETAKLHEVINVVTTIHADLREFSVRISLTTFVSIILKQREINNNYV